MNTRSIKYLAILITLAIACNSATLFPKLTPSPLPTATTQSKLLHFENERVAFDYPEGMRIFTAGDPAFVYYPDIQFGGEVIVGLGDARFIAFDTYFRSIRITRLPMPPGSNLEAMFLEAYRPVETKYYPQNGVLDANGPVTVAGLAALQKTYRVYSGEPAYELRDIWIQKGDVLSVVSIWTEDQSR